MLHEPKEAFPYKPPTEEIRQKYQHIFELTDPLPQRFFKVFFDKMVAMVMLLVSMPIFLLLKMAFIVEGWFFPESKGPMFFYYNAVSAGRIIPKSIAPPAGTPTTTACRTIGKRLTA